MSGNDLLLSTPQAAKALGVARGTLARWKREGKVKPEWVTPGGQARWNLEKLLEQLGREQR